MIIAKAHESDKDNPCCNCGLTLKQLENVQISELFYVAIGKHKMYICGDCMSWLKYKTGKIMGVKA